MRGLADDGALIYFEDQRSSPSADMLGHVVVVETDTDEVLVKRLLRGSGPGLYDLESLAGPTRRDARLRWAAHITAIIPRSKHAGLSSAKADLRGGGATDAGAAGIVPRSWCRLVRNDVGTSAALPVRHAARPRRDASRGAAGVARELRWRVHFCDRPLPSRSSGGLHDS